MELYVTDKNGVKRKVKAIFKGSEDGTPVKLNGGTPEYNAAVRLALLRGVLTYGT